MYLQSWLLWQCKHAALQAAALTATSMGLGLVKGVLQTNRILCCAGDGSREAVPGAVIRGDVLDLGARPRVSGSRLTSPPE